MMNKVIIMCWMNAIKNIKFDKRKQLLCDSSPYGCISQGIMEPLCELLSQPDNLDKEIIGLSYQLEIENCEDVAVIRMESMKRFVLEKIVFIY